MTETDPHQSIDRESTPNPNPPEKLPKKVYVIRAIFLILLWWLIASMMPFIPSPLDAVKGVLSLLKGATDKAYYAVREGSLKESADSVRAIAEEQGDDAENPIVKAHRTKRTKAFVAAEREDSAMRRELKIISQAPPVRGKIINILTMGSDARLGASNLHADAIHLITISPDSAIVEILSVPRDTYCDLGYPDTTSFNHITNARALGITGFLKRVAEVCNRGGISYYVEVGFSQVLGILELLGYKDPVQTLKFLRSRKTLRGGDIQRSHNQALFMRQSILDKFELFTGATGDLLVAAGLQFVNTNLTKDRCLGIIQSLREKGFPRHRTDAIRVRMLPIYKIRLTEMLPDSGTVRQTLTKADQVLAEEIDDGHGRINVAMMLRRKVRKAFSDSMRSSRVVYELGRMYEQRAWLQIGNRKERLGLRDSLLYVLGRAYKKLGEEAKVQQIIDGRAAEDSLYQKMGSK